MMKRLTLFEPLFQELRIRKVISHIPRGGVIVDLGCDQPPVLLDRICDEMTCCVGIDVVIRPYSYANVHILHQDLQHRIDMKSSSADVVTVMAVLEHMKHPAQILKESYRILKKDGVLLITVPTPASRPLLELFAAMGLVRKEMIEQHENYFTKAQLQHMCNIAGFRNVQVNTFECGMNTFVKAIK